MSSVLQTHSVQGVLDCAAIVLIDPLQVLITRTVVRGCIHVQCWHELYAITDENNIHRNCIIGEADQINATFHLIRYIMCNMFNGDRSIKVDQKKNLRIHTLPLRKAY